MQLPECHSQRGDGNTPVPSLYIQTTYNTSLEEAWPYESPLRSMSLSPEPPSL